MQACFLATEHRGTNPSVWTTAAAIARRVEARRGDKRRRGGKGRARGADVSTFRPQPLQWRLRQRPPSRVPWRPVRIPGGPRMLPLTCDASSCPEASLGEVFHTSTDSPWLGRALRALLRRAVPSRYSQPSCSMAASPVVAGKFASCTLHNLSLYFRVPPKPKVRARCEAAATSHESKSTLAMPVRDLSVTPTLSEAV